MQQHRRDDVKTPPSGGRIMSACVGVVCLGAAGLAQSACVYTVRIEAPDEPIHVNLHVEIDQDVRIRTEDIDDLIEENPDLF